MVKKHWSVDPSSFASDSPAHRIWKLEERINFGIGETIISRDVLHTLWATIDIDPWKRKALALALE